MANRRVRLVRSVKLNGVWKFLNPIKAQRLRIPNSEGRWYISWREGSKKKWQKADSWSHAMQLQHKKEAELHAIAAGVELPKPRPDRLKIEDAYTHFNDDLKLRERREETLEGYRLVFDTFRPTCQKQFLDQIDRQDLLRFAQAMRKAGLSPRTVSNRWLAFHAFLKHFSHHGLDQADGCSALRGAGATVLEEGRSRKVLRCLQRHPARVVLVPADDWPEDAGGHVLPVARPELHGE